MPRFDQCTIEIEFEFGQIDGKVMTVNLSTQNQSIWVMPEFKSDRLLNHTVVAVDLPGSLMLQFSGKDPDFDTQVDSNGKVIRDIYVKICSIKLDGFRVNDIFLHQRIKLHTEQGQDIVTSYIGFNGKVNLDFPEKSVFLQYLLMNC